MVALSIKIDIALGGLVHHLPGVSYMLARELMRRICSRLNQEFRRRNLQIGGAMKINEAKLEDREHGGKRYRFLSVQYLLNLNPVDYFNVAYEGAKGWMKFGVLVAKRVVDPNQFSQIVASEFETQMKEELCSRLADEIKTEMQTSWVKALDVIVDVQTATA